MAIAFFFGFVLRGAFIAAAVNGRPISRFKVIRELEKRQGMTTLDGLITEELIKQQQEAKATDLLSGTAEQPQPQPKKEMSDAEYAKSVLQGVLPKKE